MHQNAVLVAGVQHRANQMHGGDPLGDLLHMPDLLGRQRRGAAYCGVTRRVGAQSR